MKRKDLAQWTAYYTRVIDQATEGLNEKRNEYIKANAPHPIGSIVEIEDRGKTHNARIKSYEILNGLLIPEFETLDGKCLFVSRPIILG